MSKRRKEAKENRKRITKNVITESHAFMLGLEMKTELKKKSVCGKILLDSH